MAVMSLSGIKDTARSVIYTSCGSKKCEVFPYFSLLMYVVLVNWVCFCQSYLGYLLDLLAVVIVLLFTGPACYRLLQITVAYYSKQVHQILKSDTG